MTEPTGTKAATTKAKDSSSLRVIVLKKAKHDIQNLPGSGHRRSLSREQVLILEETEGFQQGVPNSPGILALNSFGARHAQWNPPQMKLKRFAGMS